ncbi:MAG: hypothetical protein HZB25_13900 [Candidatus Eisenbacteria bacterium]|nr:hypothetical protein [Candidatus Eisenbacteria bacterium]
MTDGLWDEVSTISARWGHSAIYDPVRDQMIVFGGFRGAEPKLRDIWTMSFSGRSEWSRMVPDGVPPDARYGHTAIYDPVRDRMIVFGGHYHGYLNDAWALDLSGTPTWVQLAPSGAPPPIRYAHAAVYDPVRDRMIVFGGYGDSYLNDVWALSLSGTPAWTQLAPTGTPPPGRTYSSAVYDPVHDRMVLFGGLTYTSSSVKFGDVWELTFSGPPAWSQLSPGGTPPSPRHGHRAVYDPVGNLMIVFGGNGNGATNEAWALSLGATPWWTPVSAVGEIEARYYHSVVFDPSRRQVLVFGGLGSGSFSDLHALCLGGNPRWQEIRSGAAVAQERISHSLVHDAPRHRMILWSGQSWSLLGDLWAVSTSGNPEWTMLTASGTPPPARGGYSAIYDPVRERMIVHAGWKSLYLNDVWALSLSGAPAWTQLTPSGTPPDTCRGRSAIYDPVRDRMLVYGGYYYAGSSGHWLGDVWQLTLSGSPAWTRLAPSGTPPDARHMHSAVYDPVGDRMIVFGGQGVAGSLNDVWTLSLSGSPAWSMLTPVGTPPSARNGQSGVYDPVRGRMIVVGGFSGSWSDPVDSWELALTGTPAWIRLQPAGTPPSNRSEQAAAYDPDGDRVLVHGGLEVHGPTYDYLPDLWALWFPGTVDAGFPPPGAGLRLELPRPSPAVGRMEVSFALPRAEHARILAYDIAGRCVATLLDRDLPAGTHRASWDGVLLRGGHAAAGVYVLELRAGGERSTRRVTLLR